MARRRKRRSSRGRTTQQRKFAAAARSCKGKTKGKFKACMRKKLKRSRR